MSKALLAVSFGTSFEDTRERTVGAIENALAKAFPDRKVYRAWTSGVIRRKLLKRDSLKIDSVEEALERLVAEGVTDLLVQPTFLLEGTETRLAREALIRYRDKFGTVRVGKPLLTDDGDVRELARALEERWAEIGPGQLLAFMGHGSEEAEFEPYTRLSRCFEEDGFPQMTVGTVEFTPGFAPVLETLRARRPEKVTLAPLMVVAGDHANNDMAGEEEDSWKSMLLKEGVEVDCRLEGLGEIPGVRELYVRRAAAAESL